MIDQRQRRHLLAILILALLLFNAPLVIVVDRLANSGLLPGYLFVAWMLVIGLAAVVLHRRAKR